MVKKISPLNYAFAIGKVRALEKFLIKREVFEEAVDSNADDALKLFVESNLYSEELLHIKNAQDLESALGIEVSRTKELVQGLLLDKELLCILSSESLSDLKICLKKTRSELLQDYFLHTIDMHNIKTFLRLHALKEPQDKLKAHLVYEGFIKKETFLKCYEQDLAVFLNRLEYVHKRGRVIDYASFLEDGIQKVRQDNSFVTLEREINDFLIQILKPAKYLSFGLEPILAYYFAKVNEINLIRLVILSKLNGLTTGLIKERLNSVYA